MAPTRSSTTSRRAHARQPKPVEPWQTGRGAWTRVLRTARSVWSARASAPLCGGRNQTRYQKSGGEPHALQTLRDLPAGSTQAAPSASHAVPAAWTIASACVLDHDCGTSLRLTRLPAGGEGRFVPLWETERSHAKRIQPSHDPRLPCLRLAFLLAGKTIPRPVDGPHPNPRPAPSCSARWNGPARPRGPARARRRIWALTSGLRCRASNRILDT